MQQSQELSEESQQEQPGEAVIDAVDLHAQNYLLAVFTLNCKYALNTKPVLYFTILNALVEN